MLSLGKMATHIDSKGCSTYIYTLGVGAPPHTRPNKPTHTAHGPQYTNGTNTFQRNNETNGQRSQLYMHHLVNMMQYLRVREEKGPGL
jgi:hypothetical protein